MFDAIGAPFKEKGVFSKWITIGIPYINSSLERKHQGTHDVYQCAKRLTKEIEQKKNLPLQLEAQSINKAYHGHSVIIHVHFSSIKEK